MTEDEAPVTDNMLRSSAPPSLQQRTARLREALLSSSAFWGAPAMLIRCQHCAISPVIGCAPKLWRLPYRLAPGACTAITQANYVPRL